MTSKSHVLEKELLDLEIQLKDTSYKAFEEYKKLILEWNEKINLTAITDPKEIDIKHFADSLSILKTDKLKDNMSVIDIGTGAGLPGIPLKLANASLEVTLLDSLNKRIKFLDLVIDTLNLKGIRAIHGRAEEQITNAGFREGFDICVSRAVAELSILCEWCIPFVKTGGYFIAMKGPGAEEEVKVASAAIKLLGGKLEEIAKVELNDKEITHMLVIIKKIKATPLKYPRGGGKPKKNPIR